MTTIAQNAQPDLLVLLTETISRRLGLKKEDIGIAKVLTLAEQGLGAMEDLASLLEALGAKEVRGALAKIAEAKGIADKFAALMPQYEQMKSRVDEMDAAEAETDVEMAMASLGFKKDDPAKQNLRRTLTGARKADKDGFRKEYAITPEARQLSAAAAERSHLTTPIATLHPGSQAHGPLGTMTLGANGQPVHTPQQPVIRDSLGASAVDISHYEGGNIVQKAEAHVRATDPGIASNYSAVHLKAVGLVRSGAVRESRMN